MVLKKSELVQKSKPKVYVKKGHNSYKNLDRVMYSCLLMQVMMVKRGNNSYKNLDRVDGGNDGE